MKVARILPLVLPLAACVKPKASDDTASGGSDEDVTIYDIQQGLVSDGASVTLRGVIASTPLNQYGNGFFIEEPDGGEYSGLYVYVQGSDAPSFNPYDELTISGTYAEYQPDPKDPETITELTITGASAVQVTGSGTLEPAAIDVPDDWEPWEGVLVSLPDQEVLDCANQYGEVDLSAGIEMDDAFYSFETERGATYTSITGPIHYNWGAWAILPRDDSDLAGYTAGEGCAATCAEIQQDGIEGGVTLEDVIVTSPIDSSGNFFVQDAGGGEWSGMYIYTYDDVELDLSVGDVVTIDGSATEYYDLTEVALSSADDLTASGETSEPVVLDLAEAPDDWEPYESVLVRLSDVTVTSSPDTYNEVETDWGINVDDLIADHGLEAGATCASLTGLVTYTYGAWKILPRTADDLDCTPGEAVTATVAEVQQGAVSGTVTLEGVVATTDINDSGSAFFVQDAGGGEYSGVMVYLSGDAAGAVEVARGDTVDLTGSVAEYYDFTEVQVTDPADVVVTGSATPTADALTGAPEDWEPWEGCLVTLSNVTLAGSDDGHGATPTDWTDLSLGTFLYDWTADYGDGDAFSTVTGPIYYSWEAFRVEPRDADDLVPTR